MSHTVPAEADDIVDHLDVTNTLRIPLAEIELSAVRSRGAGGQNVNKVATAIHLRFDAGQSPSLPDDVRARLLARSDSRISAAGIITIKAQESRSQERNRQAALARLAEMIRLAARKPRTRIPTRPSKAVQRKRLEEKSRRGQLKRTRGKPADG